MGKRGGHKKQHFVPATYLSAWNDPDTPRHHQPYVWVFPREGGEPKRRAPRNLFTHTDLYTIPDADGGRDLRLEQGLCGIESAFARVAHKLRKFGRGAQLTAENRETLLVFAASLHARTLSQAEHWRSEFGEVVEMGRALKAAVDKMTPSERQRLIRRAHPAHSDSPDLTLEDLEQIVAMPLQELMLPHIRAILPVFRSMNLAILSTDDEPGFITSDAPVVIGDPEHDPRSIFGIGLMSPTVEVTLPLSPRQCLILSHGGLSGWYEVGEDVVGDANRRIRFHSHREYVVSREVVNPYWFAEIPRGHVQSPSLTACEAEEQNT